MKNVSYYIVTRFNVRLFDGRKSRDKNIVPERDRLNEDYLKPRFDFFETHTYRSIYNQTNKNFKWIIMFHEDTPQVFKDRIEKLRDELSQIIPLYVPDDVDSKVALKQFLLKDAQSEWISTSRIDNDDEFLPEYMEEIQKYDGEMKKEFILSFPLGFVCCEKKNTLVWYHLKKNNSFTFVDYRSNPKFRHSLEIDHSKITNPKYGFDVIYLCNNKPEWKQNIHETNMANIIPYSFRNIIWDKKILENTEWINIKTNKDYCWYLVRMIGNSIKRFFQNVVLAVKVLFKIV